MLNARIDELKQYINYLHTQEALEVLGRADRWEALEQAWNELNGLFEAGFYGSEEAVYVLQEV